MFIRGFIGAVAISLIAGSASAATITNGDFENGDLSGWTVSNYNGNSLSSGVQSFDVTGSGASDAASFNVGRAGSSPLGGIALTQSIEVTAAGLHSFAADIAVQAYQYTNAHAGVFQLLVGGSLLDSFDFGGITNGTTERAALSGSTILGAGFYDLTIRISRSYFNSVNTPSQFVDNVSVEAPSPVPLPAGMPLLLVGLGALAVARRRN